MPNITLINLHPSIAGDRATMKEIQTAVIMAIAGHKKFGLESPQYVHLLRGPEPFIPHEDPVPVFVDVFMHHRNGMHYEEYMALNKAVAQAIWEFVKAHHNMLFMEVEVVERGSDPGRRNFCHTLPQKS